MTADLIVSVGGDTLDYEKAIDRARKSTDRYGDSLMRLESDLMKLQKQIDDDFAANLQKQHDAMDKAGRGAIVFGSALALGLGLSAREAVRWESAWAGVEKTVTGTPEQLARLEQQLRGLTEVLPASHEEIAAVAEAAGQLGVQTESITAFTRVMINLGETTNLTADEASSSIAQLMNVMKSAPEDVDNLASALVALGNNGASTEADIVSMAQRLSGAGALIGASEADVLALASAMADLGIESELGGGAMSRTLTKMYAAVKQGGAAVEDFAAIAGMSADEFATAFEGDPVRAVNSFITGLAGIKAEGGNVVGALNDLKISGTQDLQVLLRLTGAGDQLTTSLETSSQAWQENTALIEEAAKRYETTESKIQLARNAIADAGITIGQVLLPVIAEMAEFVGDVAKGWSDLPGPVKTSTVVLAAAAAAVALFGGAALVAVPKIAAFNAAVNGLQAGSLKSAGVGLQRMSSVLAGPWGAALAGGLTVLGLFVSKQGDAARTTEELRGTLDQQTGAITDNTAAWITQKLIKDGVAEDAERLGVSIATVAQAALGEKDALDQLNGAVAQSATTQEQHNAALGDFFDKSAAAKQATVDSLAADQAKSAGITALIGDVKSYADLLAIARGELDLQKTVTDAVTGSTEGAGDAAGEAAGAWREGADAAGEMAEEVKTLGEELSDLAGNFLNQRDAARNVRSTYRDIQGALRDYRKEHGSLTGAFKAGTKSGDAFAGMLDDLAQDYLKQIETTERLTGSEKATMKVYRESRSALFDVAKQLGMTDKEAEKYIRTILGTPKQAKTRFELLGTESAESRLNNLTRDRYVRVHVIGGNTPDKRGYGGQIPQADGSLMRFYANGGKENHVAQVAPAGAWRVWAEPETGGEAYIPLAASKRARSLQIWWETGRALGAVGYAKGGMTAGQTSAAIGRGREQLPDLDRVRRLFANIAQSARDAEQAEAKLKRMRKSGSASAAEIRKAEKELTRARAEAKRAADVARTAQEQLIASGRAWRDNILELGSAFGGAGESNSAQGLLAKLTSSAASGEQFRDDIKALRKSGLDSDIIKQLLDEGATSQGLALASSLRGSSADMIKKLNAEQRRLERAALGVGTVTASRASAASVGRQLNVNFNGPIQTVSVDELGRQAERRAREMLAMLRARR